MFTALPVLLMLSCVGNHPRNCSRQSDCNDGAFCSADGFCESECKVNRDCPCGATCVTSCGLCLRLDGMGPATCRAYDEGLALAEILGACPSAAPPPTDADAGVVMCELKPVTPESCAAASTPPVPSVEVGADEAGSDAGGVD